ncbi:MAG: ABC transporter permease, partial [Victivallales bacterium]|nr:ABC transporter permease [Victivallales bacterium]
ILGPLLGVAILLIVSSVMAGFDRDIRTGIMNMSAHLTFYPRTEGGFFEDPQPLIDALERECAAQGLHAAPVIEGTALMQLRTSVYPKVVRGILPERERLVTKIQENFMDQERPPLAEGEAAVGRRLAMVLGLHPGDEFLIHSPSRLTENITWTKEGKVEVREPDEFYLPEQCRVANLYSMGISDYDDNVIILHLDQAADLFGLDWGSASAIQAVVDDPMNITQLTARLRALHPECQVVNWQEKNQMLFSTLQSEKNLMTFLMAFIVLVASFTIATTLITVVVQKTREIGIMKAVGVSSFTIGRIFLLQGLIIGVVGTALGTISGLVILHYRNAISQMLSRMMGVEIFPAELYHLTSIPALTTASDLARIITMSLGICILAAVVPAIYASATTPADSLRNEN